MGITRKAASLMTMGAVDFRSDKERIARKTAKGARYQKQATKEAQAQTKILQEQTRLMVQAQQEQARLIAQTQQALTPGPVEPLGDALATPATPRLDTPAQPSLPPPPA